MKNPNPKKRIGRQEGRRHVPAIPLLKRKKWGGFTGPSTGTGELKVASRARRSMRMKGTKATVAE